MEKKSRGIVRFVFLGVLGIGGITAAAVQGRGTDEGAGEGRQMWVEYPCEATGFRPSHSE